MGDTRIEVQISRSLIDSLKAYSHGKDSVIITVKLSADTSVRELFEDVKVEQAGDSSLLTLLEQNSGASVWDCTLNPPANITDWPLSIYCEKMGVKSKNLYDAGWFPSGKIFLAAPGLDPTTILKATDIYEDRQYNNFDQGTYQDVTTGSSSSQPKVMLAQHYGGALPLPSQVFKHVKERFHDYEQSDSMAAAAREEQRKNHLLKVAKQRERNRKLDVKIHQLEAANGKNKKVSEQVQRMLIKSRATGRSDLKMQDRLYFHCIIVNDTDQKLSKEEYRYFSSQDTVGRVVSSFGFQAGGMQAEMLIRIYGDQDAFEYRRLPLLLRLYEIISRKLLAEFDTIIIRFFDPMQNDPTIVVDDDSFDTAVDHQHNPEVGLDSKEMAVLTETSVPVISERNEGPTLVSNSRLHAQISFALEDGKGHGKNTSSSVVKVRQMQMKSKATGDAKRVKMNDRFFVDLVVIEDGENCKVTRSPVFLCRTDAIGRLTTDIFAKASLKEKWEYELLVPSDDGESFLKIPDVGLRFCDAEAAGVLKCFDRIVLRFVPCE
jgi:hypothetical protein